MITRRNSTCKMTNMKKKRRSRIVVSIQLHPMSLIKDISSRNRNKNKLRSRTAPIRYKLEGKIGLDQDIKFGKKGREAGMEDKEGVTDITRSGDVDGKENCNEGDAVRMVNTRNIEVYGINTEETDGRGTRDIDSREILEKRGDITEIVEAPSDSRKILEEHNHNQKILEYQNVMSNDGLIEQCKEAVTAVFVKNYMNQVLDPSVAVEEREPLSVENTNSLETECLNQAVEESDTDITEMIIETLNTAKEKTKTILEGRTKEKFCEKEVGQELTETTSSCNNDSVPIFCPSNSPCEHQSDLSLHQPRIPDGCVELAGSNPAATCLADDCLFKENLGLIEIKNDKMLRLTKEKLALTSRCSKQDAIIKVLRKKVSRKEHEILRKKAIIEEIKGKRRRKGKINNNIEVNLYQEIVDTRVKLEEILRENNEMIEKVEQEKVNRIVCENKRLISEEVIHSLKDELDKEKIISRQLKEQLDNKIASTLLGIREEEDTVQITDGGSNVEIVNSLSDQEVDRKKDFDVEASNDVYRNGYQSQFKMWIENYNDNKLGDNRREDDKNQEGDVTGEARNAKLNQYDNIPDLEQQSSLTSASLSVSSKQVLLKEAEALPVPPQLPQLRLIPITSLTESKLQPSPCDGDSEFRNILNEEMEHEVIRDGRIEIKRRDEKCINTLKHNVAAKVRDMLEKYRYIGTAKNKDNKWAIFLVEDFQKICRTISIRIRTEIMVRCQQRFGSLKDLALEEEDIHRIKSSIEFYFNIRKLISKRLDLVEVVESWRDGEVQRLSLVLFCLGINDWRKLTDRIKLYCNIVKEVNNRLLCHIPPSDPMFGTNLSGFSVFFDFKFEESRILMSPYQENVKLTNDMRSVIKEEMDRYFTRL